MYFTQIKAKISFIKSLILMYLRIVRNKHNSYIRHLKLTAIFYFIIEDSYKTKVIIFMMPSIKKRFPIIKDD